MWPAENPIHYRICLSRRLGYCRGRRFFDRVGGETPIKEARIDGASWPPAKPHAATGVVPEPVAGPVSHAGIPGRDVSTIKPRKGGSRVYELKTRETETSPQAVIDRIAQPGRRKDAQALLDIYASVTGYPPRVWGEKQIGYGRYRYKYPSGHQGEFYRTGFAPTGAKISLYLYIEEDAREETLRRLGKATSGKSCVYINKLDDIDIGVLKEIIAETVRFMSTAYPGGSNEAKP